MKSESAPFADAAPMLYEHGFNVLPIISSRKCPPAKVSWHEWRSARQTLDEIRRLREAFQTHDVAIILGRVSSLVDLDVDNGEVGEQSLQALGRPILPTTAFTSPGDPRKQKKPGRHLLYRHHDPLPTQRLGTRLELRADGSYTIVPPSVGRVWMLGLEHLADLPEAWTRPLAGRRVNPLPLHPRSQVGQVPPQSVLLASVSVLLATEGLKAVEAAADFLPRVAFLLGVSPDLGRGFRCPLPGHGPDKRPSATLLRAEDGTIKLHDWHRKDGLEFFSLAEVLAAQRSGRVRSLNGPELATWKLRLLVEAGLVDPIHVDMPPLPPEASPITHRVLAAFCYLLSCKWLYTAGVPSPFTWKFAAGWCGVPERQAGEAIRELLRLGALRRVGTWKRTTSLYLPGGVAQ